MGHQIMSGVDRQMLLEASLASAERQIQELQSKLEQCEAKLKSAEMKTLEMVETNMQQERELISSTSRILQLEEQLHKKQETRTHHANPLSKSHDTGQMYSGDRYLSSSENALLNALDDCQRDAFRDANELDLSRSQQSLARIKIGSEKQMRRPASAHCKINTFDLEASLCNLSSPEPYILAKNTREPFTYRKQPLWASSSQDTEQFDEDQENFDPGNVRFPRKEDSWKESFRKGLLMPGQQFLGEDKGHISPTPMSNKKTSKKFTRLSSLKFRASEFGPLGKGQQAWQADWVAQNTVGDRQRDKSSPRQPLSVIHP